MLKVTKFGGSSLCDSAGFARVRVRPQLGDLRYAKGTVPTPRGLLRVEAERQPNGSVRVKIDAPEGITVEQ